jgi:hypothetical protein
MGGEFLSTPTLLDKAIATRKKDYIAQFYVNTYTYDDASDARDDGYTCYNIIYSKQARRTHPDKSRRRRLDLRNTKSRQGKREFTNYIITNVY